MAARLWSRRDLKIERLLALAAPVERPAARAARSTWAAGCAGAGLPGRGALGADRREGGNRDDLRAVRELRGLIVKDGPLGGTDFTLGVGDSIAPRLHLVIFPAARFRGSGGCAGDWKFERGAVRLRDGPMRMGFHPPATTLAAVVFLFVPGSANCALHENVRKP